MPVVAALAPDAHTEIVMLPSQHSVGRSVDGITDAHYSLKKNKRMRRVLGEERKVVPEKNLSLPTKKMPMFSCLAAALLVLTGCLKVK